MMKVLALLLVAIVALGFIGSVSADHEAKCHLNHLSSDKYFNCTIYQQDFDGEYRLRIDVCFVEDGDNSVCESIVQRFDRLVGGLYRISSQLIIGEPWTNWRRCCQHDALGQIAKPTIDFVVGEVIPIIRSDNYTEVEIVEILDTSDNLEEIILNHWDEAADFCSLRCAASSDVMFNIDNSGSINGEEFNLMSTFIQQFIGAFTISPSKTNLGIVLFNGRFSCGNDRFYIPKAGLEDFAPTNSQARDYFMDTALVNTSWADPIGWGERNISTVNYFRWTIQTDNTADAGYAFLELYMTSFEHEVTNVLNNIGDGQLRHKDHNGFTAMGTGIQLAVLCFYRNGNRPSDGSGQNGFPRLLLTLADGKNNRGLLPATAAAQAELVPNITLIGIGIGAGVRESEIIAVSSDAVEPHTNTYYVTSFDQAQFDAVLIPLISGSCLGESNNAVPCSASCSSSGGLCTACGDCIQCVKDDDCPSCGFCSQSPFGTCVVDVVAAKAKCATPNACEVVFCDPTKSREEMCVIDTDNADAILAAEKDCRGDDLDQPFDFDEATCLCSPQPGDGDGGVAAGAIAGGVAAGAIALLLLLGLLAALLLLAVLAALFVIVAVVIAALVMLAFGVTMAIPPSITALEVTAPNQVVNEENPLAVDQMEWVESAAQ